MDAGRAIRVKGRLVDICGVLNLGMTAETRRLLCITLMKDTKLNGLRDIWASYLHQIYTIDIVT